jgi:hypothetical protein
MKSHHDMRTAAKISLWLGKISDEGALDDYLGGFFSRDFGFEIYAPDGPEVSAQAETDVRTLLTGFSRWQNFIDIAVSTAAAAGIVKASSAIIFYNFAYDPSLIRNHNAPFRFVGVLPYANL